MRHAYLRKHAGPRRKPPAPAPAPLLTDCRFSAVLPSPIMIAFCAGPLDEDSAANADPRRPHAMLRPDSFSPRGRCSLRGPSWRMARRSSSGGRSRRPGAPVGRVIRVGRIERGPGGSSPRNDLVESSSRRSSRRRDRHQCLERIVVGEESSEACSKLPTRPRRDRPCPARSTDRDRDGLQRLKISRPARSIGRRLCCRRTR